MVCTTPAALEEYQAGAHAGLLPASAWRGLPVVALNEGEAAFAAGLPPRLGLGERACLSVAAHRRGLLATDDLDARETARSHRLPVTGTLGILILAWRQGLLDREEANELLGAMIALGYHSPVSELDALLPGE